MENNGWPDKVFVDKNYLTGKININTSSEKFDLVEGRAELVVIDIQKSACLKKEVRSIAHIPEYEVRMAHPREAVNLIL
ncbi:MAG: hypothetical protein N2B60_01675 [Psychrobacter sp.]